MGQAGNKGPKRTSAAPQMRVMGAAGQTAAPVLVCNACNAVLKDVAPLETSHLKGITQAFGAHCAACDLDTWAVRGDPAAVRAFYAALEKAAGQAVQMGTAKPSS